jgi:hypothetical protein
MARNSGGGGFGWFVVGIAVGVAGTIYGPGVYKKYVLKEADTVRVDVPAATTPSGWQRMARFDIEFSRFRADGKNWDWPFTDPELQLCIRQGDEYRKCFGPKDFEVAACQGKFKCTTAAIQVPPGRFIVELNEWDDWNPVDPIGSIECDIGETCKFALGIVTVRAAGGATAAR